MHIGLFGGTFDPIHTAHLKLSTLILERYNLDKVIFIPSGNSYFKTNVTDKWDRFRMVKLATEDYFKFDVSDIEIKRDGNTYTFETIMELKKEYESDVLYWIMGSDTFLQLPKWRNHKYLLENIRFIVYMRPGDSLNKTKKISDDFKSMYGTHIQIMEDEQFYISSSEIREHFYDPNFNQTLISENVYNYILKHNLYR